MAVPSLQTVSIAGGDTFGTFVSKVNAAINEVQNTVVTIAANTAGGMTTGNGFVTGIFGANTLVATNIKAGNVQSGGSLINVQSNAVFSGSLVTVVGSLALSNGFSTLSSANLVTTGTSQVTLDSWAVATYRSAKYLIQITDNNSTATHQVTEILMMSDGGANAYSTEYATMVSNGTIGSFTVDVSSGNARLRYTPVSSNTSVKFMRTIVAV